MNKNILTDTFSEVTFEESKISSFNSKLIVNK